GPGIDTFLLTFRVVKIAWSTKVTKRIGSTWPVEVIGPRDDNPWNFHQGFQRGDDVVDRIRATWVITGVDDQIWFEISQASNEFDFAPIPGDYMHVANVQNP